jgi:DUF4097 and DUF4098 domain-containing protein YvlB
MTRLLCAALLAFLPTLAGAWECRYSAERNFDVDAAGLGSVAFDLGSSDVVVEGVPGLARVEVRGRACASDEAWLDRLTVDQRRSGDRLEVAPHDGHDLKSSWFGSSYAYVDLRVRVPSKLAIDVRSQSGDAEIRNVAALDFEASSGDLLVDHVAGVLSAKVSSGDVHGEDIGSVDIRSTSSGDVNLRNVHGDANIGRTGSGDLAFIGVGSVHVGSVGSGDVMVDQAAGDVSVDSIGSGDVSVDTVEGNFRVGSKGSGDVQHRNVRGTVSVPHDDD